MALTTILTKILGPVLLLRAISIVVDRQHFVDTLQGLDREAATVSFSAFPIALLIACIALVLLHTDSSSVAAWLIRLLAWGGIVKATALILVPRAVVAKGQLLGEAGFLNVVLVVCLAVGGYFTWFGYIRSRR
jgi:hypothetical protein